MQRILKKICRAIFVLPFTAGIIKVRRNGTFPAHDGSISGLVLLTTLIIIVFEFLQVTSIDDTRYPVMGLLILAEFSLILVGALVRWRSYWIHDRKRKEGDKLKLKFLWLFCFANIIYTVTELATVIDCEDYTSLPATVLVYVFLWICIISQTIFIHFFSSYTFASIVWVYYILMFLFLANISVWTQRTIDDYTEDASEMLNTTLPICNSNSTLHQTYRKMKPFLQPALLEYCLLSMIFISEMWPKASQKYDLMPLFHSSSFHDSESTEYQILLSTGENFRTSQHHLSKKSIILASLCLLYTLSFSILQLSLLYTYNEQQSQLNSYISGIYFLIGNCLRLPLNIKCFYELSGELKPKQKPRKTMNTKNFIIVVTSVVTSGYFLLEGFTIENQTTILKTRNVVTAIIKIVATLLQTTFILQMKHYRKGSNSEAVFSIRNVFLYMCIVNFSSWFFCTFVDAQSEIVDPGLHFSPTTWLKVKHFWFPFVIFYHFECFVTFYHFII